MLLHFKLSCTLLASSGIQGNFQPEWVIIFFYILQARKICKRIWDKALLRRSATAGFRTFWRLVRGFLFLLFPFQYKCWHTHRKCWQRGSSGCISHTETNRWHSLCLYQNLQLQMKRNIQKDWEGSILLFVPDCSYNVKSICGLCRLFERFMFGMNFQDEAFLTFSQ